jgi:hypothetical protein
MGIQQLLLRCIRPAGGGPLEFDGLELPAASPSVQQILRVAVGDDGEAPCASREPLPSWRAPCNA